MNDEENEPLTSRRSPRPQFNYFYGSSATAATTPPTSVHNDEQDSLVGEELVSTDNEGDIPTNSDDDETYQRGLKTFTSSTASSTTASRSTFVSCSPILVFLLLVGAASVCMVLLIPPQQRNILPQTQSFDMPFPRVDRADFGDPVEGFIDMDLFARHLIRDAPGDVDNNDNNASHSRSFSLPFPTGAFWTNLVVPPPGGDSMSYPIAVYPFAYRWSSSSLKVSYPAGHRMIKSHAIQDPFIPELTLTTEEEITNRHVMDYNPLSVTLRFVSSSSPDSKWETALVQGSPYVTLTYTEQTPVLKPLSIFSDVQCPGVDDDDFSDLPDENGGEGEGERKLFGVCSIDVRTKSTCSANPTRS